MMHLENEHDRTERPPGSLFVAAVICALCAMYFALGNDFNTPLMAIDNFQLEKEDIEESVEVGNTIWRLAFVGIGVIGGALFILPGDRKLHIGSLLSLSIVAALVWTVLSVLWSVDPPVTLRRVIGLMCLLAGTLGFAKHFSASQLCIFALAYGVMTLTASVAAEAYHGTFAPWDGDYRFAGTSHPNQQAIRMSVLLLSCVSLARYNAKWRPLLIPLAIAAFCVLLMTKSRTSLVSSIVGLVALWALDASTKFKLVSSLVVITLLVLAVMAILTAGVNVDVDDAFRLGRSEAETDPGRFTGRLPLWEYALEHIAERPWLGYGFNSFWSADQLADAHYELEWALPDAHNAYLDTILSIGLIGMMLVLLVIALGSSRVAAKEVRRRDTSYAFIAGLCAFGAVNGLGESHMLQPFNITPFLIAAAFNRLAFFARPRIREPLGPEPPVAYREADVVWDA